MSLEIQQSKVKAVLLDGAGWQNVQQGTFQVDRFEIVGAPQTPEAEDYGFTYKEPQGPVRVTGRLSALLAVKE